MSCPHLASGLGWALACVMSLAAGLMGPSMAAARVFSFKNESFAPYIRGTTGLARLGQDPFVHSSGAGTAFDDKINYTFSGEIGFLLALTDKLHVRLGAEAIRPKELQTKGKNSGGTELFTLTSSVFVFNPSLTIEYVYSEISGMRFYLYGGAGYAQVSMDNQYVMTTAGNTAFNPISDHTEKGEATVYSGHAGMGFETLFADNVTFAMDFGYRHLPVRELKHKDDTPTITEASVTKGTPLKNSDGSNRSLDLGGLTVAASFRFYVSF